MENVKELQNKEEIFEHSESYVIKLYNDLTKAISSNDYKSIWELSKAITRYHFKQSNE
ncbi:MAG: hypothetical protein ACFFBH_01120 [Promethearchaeota archaeon]